MPLRDRYYHEVYRIRSLSGTVGLNYVPIRLPQGRVGERFPRFRQIIIQNTSTVVSGNKLTVMIDDNTDFPFTVFPTTNIPINVSEHEALEIEKIQLKGSAAGTTWEIILLYPLRNEETDATPP